MPVAASKAKKEPLKLPGSEPAKNPAGNVRQQALLPSFPDEWEVTPQTWSLTSL